MPVSGTTILAYDVLINLSDEVNYIWPVLDRSVKMKKSERIAKLVLLLSRYMMLATAAESLIGMTYTDL